MSEKVDLVEQEREGLQSHDQEHQPEVTLIRIKLQYPCFWEHLYHTFDSTLKYFLLGDVSRPCRIIHCGRRK